jgi:hypothetical protein
MRRVSRRLAMTGVILLAAVVLSGCGDDDGRNEAASKPGGLPARTVESGEVTVEITPLQLTAGGASFTVVFDTHSVDLDLDVAEASTLVIDGQEWTAARWDGAGPGGHHREGTLTFDANGEPTGEAVLTIDGLPEPVRSTWQLEAS